MTSKLVRSGVVLSLVLFLHTLNTHAQVAHTVTVGATASVTPGVSGYNWYRSATTNGTYTKLTTTPMTGTSFTDTTVQPGQTYFYKATAVCPAAGCGNGITGESVLSAASPAAVIPTDQPQPPTNLTITSVAMNFNTGTTTVYAKWQSAPGTTNWTLYNKKGKTIGTGISFSANGTYFMYWGDKGREQSVTLKVCDQDSCKSKTT